VAVDSPPVIVIALTLSAALLLVEVALPTFGVAGIGGFALLWVGVAGVAEGDDTWAPLMLIAVAVCLWAVQIVRTSPSPAGRLVAAGVYAAGAIGFGVAARSIGAVIVGMVGAAALSAGFPFLLGATQKLADLPAQTGLEAFDGRTATVTSWDPATNRGTVRLDGSLWNATSTVPVRPGDEVLVVGHERMELRITPTSVAP
jgi:membrane-bound ClpP family serine protease